MDEISFAFDEKNCSPWINLNRSFASGRFSSAFNSVGTRVINESSAGSFYSDSEYVSILIRGINFLFDDEDSTRATSIGVLPWFYFCIYSSKIIHLRWRDVFIVSRKYFISRS